MLASQESANNVMLQDDGAPILVDVLDQVFDTPNAELNLRRHCSPQTILPLSCILSGNITKEGDTPVASGAFANAWKGCYNGHRVCIKELRVRSGGGLSKIRQRLFQEVVIWRRLAHPNVLAVLGVSPELFPLCVVTEWMNDGNIMDFTSKHPEANRFRLLAEASQGLRYLHSMRIIHNRLKPENIFIDCDHHPRLADYGLPFRLDILEGESHCCGGLQYLSPELLDPSSFGLEKRTPTKESDSFAFGMVIYQVLTGQQPFHGVKPSISDIVVAGIRPHRPPGSDEWLPGDVWDLISRCWSQSWNNRPDPSTLIITLDDAGDAIELRSRGFREQDLISFLNGCKGGPKNDRDVEKAQGIVDMLDSALDNGDLHKRKRKRCLKYLRRSCGTFGILPSSFILEPTFNDRGTKPFATGGFSHVYEAIFDGRPVAIKTLRIAIGADPEKAHKLLVKEVVGWKWLRHENILPFVGVTLASPILSIVSERMENGNITEFVTAYPEYNRLRLLVGVATGLEYLHERDVVHGDLKGANILIDSECCAHLADFGLALAIDESTAGSTADHRGMRGTIRWMAPEVMYPEKFGFVDEHRKRLPSRSTDIYALGMTILEVVTGCPPFNDIRAELAVMCKVLEGGRPDRPSLGFSDQLWELLTATWLVEQASQPPKRPSTSTILNRLNGELHTWGRSIIPPAPAGRQQRSESTDRVSSRSEDNVPEIAQMTTVALPIPPHFCPPQADPKKTTGRNPSCRGVVGNARGLILGFFSFFRHWFIVSRNLGISQPITGVPGEPVAKPPNNRNHEIATLDTGPDEY